MSWDFRFGSDLRNERYNSIELLICTRPDFNGRKMIPSEFSAGASVGWSSLPPRLVRGIADAGVSNWSESFPVPVGADLIRYSESAQSIALRSWKPKGSTFTFEVFRPERHINGSEPWSVSGLSRGLLIEVFAGFEGYSWEEYQRIHIGVISQVTVNESSVTIQCDEAWTQFLGPSVSAWSLDAATMFEGAGRQFVTNETVDNDETDINYLSTGEGPIIEATSLEDGTIGGYEPKSLTVDKTFICIEVADNDAPQPKNVYLRGKAGATFFRRHTDDHVKGLQYDWFYHDIGDDVHSVPPGETVIDFETPFLVFYVPNPLDTTQADGLSVLLRRLLTSTGKYSTSDQNGPHDTLHHALGFGVPFELVDLDEADTWHSQFDDRDLDLFKWTPFITQETDDGWKVIESALSHFGIWVCLREGQYTLRSAISHAYDGEGIGKTTATISDGEIVSVRRHQLFAPNCRVEHTRVTTQALENATPPTTRDLTQYDQTDKGSYGSMNIASRPFSGTYSINVADGPLVANNPTTPSARTCWPFGNKNEDKHAARFASLQYQWFTRIPEVVEVELSGLRFASFVPGDLVLVRSSMITGRHGEWDNRPAMIQSIRRDWLGGRVTVTLASLPPDNR